MLSLSSSRFHRLGSVGRSRLRTNVRLFSSHAAAAEASALIPPPTISSPVNTAPILPQAATTHVPTNAISFPRLGVQTVKYSVNLSKLALEGKLDPVIGRDDEIDRAIQILSRRTKNNPCFIGEPGVGKTAIAEELARKIVSGKVPEWFKNKVILTLDLPSMLAGTKFRGEFEERFKGVLKEIEQCGDRIILFIDELHIIAGAGGSEGAIDASNILKPSLSRGQIRCMGATTSDEYRKYIEKDAALARRFQSVFVSEPTNIVAKEILFGLKEKFELFHNIVISDDAIVSAVNLSEKYVTDRRFPDKAIDLLDEACSKLRIDLDSTPICKTTTKSNEELNETWIKFRNRIKDLYNIRSQMFDLKAEMNQCRQNGNIERANFIENVEIIEKGKLFNEFNDMFKQSLSETCEVFKDSNIMVKRGNEPHTLRGIDVAGIITKQTGIPVGSLLESEKVSLLNMETEIASKVIGQNEAIQAISKCIRLSRAGLRYHDRPLGVFLMIGGTGVGKTEVAKALSEFLFHDTNATHMLRIDMSEYMERFSVSRLIGAPPGYVGYEEGGALTESVRRRPYQVVLLDEFEKAHKDVSNLLLQVFDEGRLSDSQGRVVDFRNTVIIMTSNLNSKDLINIEDKATKALMARTIVGSHFAPEFVNRLDDVIVFNPLNEEAINEICKIQLRKVEKLLKERGIDIDIEPDVISWLGKTGYDPLYGARPLKRLIQTKLLDPLATVLLEDKLRSGHVLSIKLRPISTTENNASDDVLYKEAVDEDNCLEFILHHRK